VLPQSQGIVFHSSLSAGVTQAKSIAGSCRVLPAGYARSASK
jgi:hypothetical protein